MTDTMAERFSAEIVRAQIVSVLRAWGMAEDNIAVTAEIMVETDLLGVDSHGLSMLILYEQMQNAGQSRLAAEPRIVRQSAATTSALRKLWFKVAMNRHSASSLEVTARHW
jgi:LDH2 family malate/lactate/ureidoglycolate dehydrogenase